jgi:hypothetical protein
MWRNIEACETKPSPQMSQHQRYTTFPPGWSAETSGATIRSEQNGTKGHVPRPGPENGRFITVVWLKRNHVCTPPFPRSQIFRRVRLFTRPPAGSFPTYPPNCGRRKVAAYRLKRRALVAGGIIDFPVRSSSGRGARNGTSLIANFRWHQPGGERISGCGTTVLQFDLDRIPWMVVHRPMDHRSTENRYVSAQLPLASILSITYKIARRSPKKNSCGGEHDCEERKNCGSCGDNRLVMDFRKLCQTIPVIF